MTSHVETGLEIWVLIALNFLGVFLGVVITGISYYAYRTSNRKTSLRRAAIGFGFLTLGIAAEPAYQLGIIGTHTLASDHNLSLQLVEGLLISLGFLTLFSSIYQYGLRYRQQTVTVSGVDDELFDESD